MKNLKPNLSKPSVSSAVANVPPHPLFRIAWATPSTATIDRLDRARSVTLEKATWKVGLPG
jgi:hypothetical protein